MSQGTRHALLRALDHLVPKSATTLRSIRSRRLSHRLVREWGLTEIGDSLIARYGLTVAGGPFIGLRLPDAAREDHLGPYLLGTYESELHPWLDELRDIAFERVLDVGAKFGYYALGLARWFPHALSLAWDTDPWARRATRQGARLNGLSNVEVHGYLAPDALAAFTKGPTLLLSDCEGYEAELFTTTPPDALASTWMIVETHESRVPGVTQLLAQRFAATHTLDLVNKAARAAPETLVALLGARDAARAVTEPRGDQTWLLLRPRQPRGKTPLT